MAHGHCRQAQLAARRTLVVQGAGGTAMAAARAVHNGLAGLAVARLGLLECSDSRYSLGTRG